MSCSLCLPYQRVRRLLVGCIEVIMIIIITVMLLILVVYLMAGENCQFAIDTRTNNELW